MNIQYLIIEPILGDSGSLLVVPITALLPQIVIDMARILYVVRVV
jgi:hypothetical protein